jgi:pyruvate dehydrogenase E2 component (dihydrolipoamide acetyltransferase)
MSLFEFRLPDIGEGVSEGEIVAWHTAAGEHVIEDSVMVEVMTDKATVEIGAPRSGRVASTRAAIGERINVGAVLVVIETADPIADAAPAPVAIHRATNASAVGDLRESLPGVDLFCAAMSELSAHDAGAARPRATPSTRKRARQLGIGIEELTTRAIPTLAPIDAGAAAKPLETERRSAFVGLRRKIAERMQHSVRRAAHFTYVDEVDVGRLRALILAADGGYADVKLSYLPFIVKAVCGALDRHPHLNAWLDEERNEIVHASAKHIGIATATELGLLVPVLFDAHTRSVLQLAREIKRISTAARRGELTPRELTGSTFSVSSLGKLGGLMATPLLNDPEVGILAAHQVKERAVVRDGAVVVGHTMNLSLSFDHRLIDGHQGAAFARDVIELLEHPERLLLG